MSPRTKPCWWLEWEISRADKKGAGRLIWSFRQSLFWMKNKTRTTFRLKRVQAAHDMPIHICASILSGKFLTGANYKSHLKGGVWKYNALGVASDGAHASLYDTHRTPLQITKDWDVGHLLPLTRTGERLSPSPLTAAATLPSLHPCGLGRGLTADISNC